MPTFLKSNFHPNDLKYHLLPYNPNTLIPIQILSESAYEKNIQNHPLNISYPILPNTLIHPKAQLIQNPHQKSQILQPLHYHLIINQHPRQIVIFFSHPNPYHQTTYNNAYVNGYNKKSTP